MNHLICFQNLICFLMFHQGITWLESSVRVYQAIPSLIHKKINQFSLKRNKKDTAKLVYTIQKILIISWTFTHLYIFVLWIFLIWKGTKSKKLFFNLSEKLFWKLRNCCSCSCDVKHRRARLKLTKKFCETMYLCVMHLFLLMDY